MRIAPCVAVLLLACGKAPGALDSGEPADAAENADSGVDAAVDDAGIDAGPADDGGLKYRDAGLLWRDGGTGEEPPGKLPFSFQMAGAFVLNSEPLTASPQTLLADHFSYVGQYAMNLCANDNAPYSCAANGCAYPGSPPVSNEISDYPTLANWLKTNADAGLYVGLWGVTQNNPEAEGHCMAEIANTLKNTYGVAISFYDVDGEKSYETNQGYSLRFVSEFNKTLTFPIAKAYTPECHNAVPFSAWLTNGWSSIQPMAYWNDAAAGSYPPDYCIRYDLQSGVPASGGQAMLDGYRHGSPHAWAEYADSIVDAGTVGFSIWRTLNASEWDQFKPLIEQKPIAAYDARPATAIQVTASSSYNAAFPPSNLIDGDTNSFAHTLSEPGAWLAVDFGVPRLFDGVRLWNRADCCADRISNYRIEVDPDDCAFDNAAVVADVTATPAGRPSTFAFAPRTGRCVRLKLNDTNYLDPAELELHRNLAREARVSASSEFDPAVYPSSNLVDGKRSDAAATQSEPQPWFKLDLKRVHEVDAIALFNRADCCADRLKSYTIDLDPDDCAFDNAVRVADATNQPAGSPSWWAFRALRARCVRLQLKDTNYLNASELQVFGY